MRTCGGYYKLYPSSLHWSTLVNTGQHWVPPPLPRVSRQIAPQGRRDSRGGSPGPCPGKRVLGGRGFLQKPTNF
jgi:hypothetical protein